MPTRLPPRSSKSTLAIVVLLGIAGCASTSRPVVYPSARVDRSERAESDIRICQAEARAAVGINGTSTPQTGTRAAQRGAGIEDDLPGSEVEQGRNELCRLILDIKEPFLKPGEGRNRSAFLQDDTHGTDGRGFR